MGFDGERLDPISGTTHLGNGYRAYSPVLMRFNCPDIMSPFGAGGINLYVYCEGDPVNQMDPSGHFSLGQWIGMGAGLLTGIVLGIVMEGVAIPVLLELTATMSGDAYIGAGSELVGEALDGQRINWGWVSISAGMGAADALLGYGVGKGISNAYGAVKVSLSRVTGAFEDTGRYPSGHPASLMHIYGENTFGGLGEMQAALVGFPVNAQLNAQGLVEETITWPLYKVTRGNGSPLEILKMDLIRLKDFLL